MRAGILVLPLVLMIGFAACNREAASPNLQKQAIPAGEVGSRLPEFRLKDMQGNEISSEGLRGKVVLIDIWATWCGPCRKEMPGYQKLLDNYGPRGLAVIGLKSNMMMDTEEPMKFAKEIGVHYPLVNASAETIDAFGKLEGLPTTMIYDRNGILRQKVIGFDYPDNFERSVKALL